ncbi:MAG TPA: ferredoxin [Candidatus Binataceae bacterium]|nr:ferredoxin [Candidatus Binataceae bacterium]
MRVVVDHNLCEGNARCNEIAPEVFELRDDDRSYVLLDNPPASMRAKVERAIGNCPRQAIRLIED